MNTAITDIIATEGVILYDAECSLCLRSAKRFDYVLRRAGFALKPLQDSPAVDMREMLLLMPDGRRFGGANAILQIAGRIWWARPLSFLAKIPGVTPLLHAAYRKLAANRRMKLFLLIHKATAIRSHLKTRRANPKRHPRRTIPFLDLP